MKLLTVVVNYRTARYVVESLAALGPQLVAADAEVWIVDNLSPDDSLEVLRRGIASCGFEGRVRLLESPRNGGFGAGNNVALREALALPNPPEYVYLLNPDAKPDEDVLPRLVAFLDAHPRAGAVGTAIRNPDGTPHVSRFRFPSLLSEIESALALGLASRLLAEHRVPIEDQRGTERVDWVSGASIALRTQALREIGLFDERFFLYFEEVDLCHRLHAGGWEVWMLADVSVGHVGGAATGTVATRRIPSWWFESRSYYLRKTHGSPYLHMANLLHVAGFSMRRLRRLLMGRGVGDSPHYLRDFVRHTFFPKRDAGA
jgi:GT2 family glycosyltransferase